MKKLWSKVLEKITIKEGSVEEKQLTPKQKKGRWILKNLMNGGFKVGILYIGHLFDFTKPIGQTLILALIALVVWDIYDAVF